MDRPEYVTCIMAPSKNHTLCGHHVSGIFVFQSVEHAFLDVWQGGRLMICPDCAQVVVDTINNGTYDEDTI